MLTRRHHLLQRRQQTRSKHARHQIILTKRETKYVVGNQGSLFYRSLIGSEAAIISIVRSFLSHQEVAHTIRLENSTYIYAQSHPFFFRDKLRRNVNSINLKTGLVKIAGGPIRPTWMEMGDQHLTNLNVLKCMTMLVTLDLFDATGPWIDQVDAYASLPASITTLILPSSARGPFGQFPPSLTSLRMNLYPPTPLVPGILPQTLLHLEMPFSYCGNDLVLIKGSLPGSLTSLHLPENCNQHMVSTAGILPESLTFLKVYISGHNQLVLREDVFPPRLTSMHVQSNQARQNHFLRILPSFPVTLTQLKIDALTGTMHLAPKLEHLEYTSSELVFPMSKKAFPISMRELVINTPVVFHSKDIVNVLVADDDEEDKYKLVNLRSIIVKNASPICYRMPVTVTSVQTDRLPMYLEKHHDGIVAHHCFRDIILTFTIFDSSIDMAILNNINVPVRNTSLFSRMKPLDSARHGVYKFQCTYPICLAHSFVFFFKSCISLLMIQPLPVGLEEENKLMCTSIMTGNGVGMTYTLPHRLSIHVHE